MQEEYEMDMLNTGFFDKEEDLVKNKHRSIIDRQLYVSNELWVVSLIRKRAGTKHVYLLLEGINQFGCQVIRRYDLVMHDQREGFAKIIIFSTEEGNDNNTKKEPVFFKKKKRQHISKSWNISKKKAHALHRNILADKKTAEDIDYGILYFAYGNESLILKSTGKEAHSCFTWAREKLMDLNEPVINKYVEAKMIDLIAADPSIYLEDESISYSRRCCVFM